MPMPILLLLLLLLPLPLSMIPSHGTPQPDNYTSPSPSAPASPVNFTTCSTPSNCSGVLIQYPFYLSEAPNIPLQYCGYPGMGVFCDNEATPILLTESGNYTITRIDYDSRTVSVSDTDVYDASESACVTVQHNFTFYSSSTLYFTPSDANLTFFFNCSPILSANADPILCLSNSYVFPPGAPQVEDEKVYLEWASKCSDIVMAPVLHQNININTTFTSFAGYGGVLKDGFQLSWSELESDNCKSCEGSGGRCGFNRTTDSTNWAPNCFCSDGLNRFDCGDADNSNSNKGSAKGSKKSKKRLFVIVTAPSFTIFFVFMLLGLLWKRRRRIGKKNFFSNQSLANNHWEIEERASELLLFDFFRITNATNNFSAENKLGRGGFGPVYKGQLPDGQEIAVKRLARNSGQGLVEFKNEILVIAKLQHINLVKLLGYSIQGEEKILIYEFMPNKSLDFFLFDQTRGSLLDWPKRFRIIEGVAQGLLYLHKHSRLKIIHRDLKASNILLDGYMNPKISDFGLARIFYTNEDQGNFTNKVAGTFGYISPEYAADGHFSIKSDVFSFGVLLLEIVSGKRNAGLNQYGDFLNLLGYAWEVWKEGRWLELVDPSLGDGYSMDQMMKCIHVALLCVQEKPGDRPAMWTVTMMLSSESSTALPVPTQPGFFNLRARDEADETCSLNRMTVTDPVVR